MTLTQLEYIISLDTHRHFVTAADACFVTQPTLSMQIQKLEEELGTLLFDRSKQPIIPTLEGARIVEQARIILQESKRLKEIVLEEKGILKGELHVGIIPTLSPYLVPLFLQSFLSDYPDIKLKISEITTAEIIQRLRNETLDVGILATPLNEAGIFEETLFYEPFVAYLPQDHPLKQQKLLNALDLQNEKLLLMEESHCFRGQVLSFCNYKIEQGSSNLQYEAGSIETLKKLVDRNMGMTILPELAIMDMDEDSLDNVHYFASPEPMREIGMVFTRSQLKAKLMQIFAQSIKASLPEKISKIISMKNALFLCFLFLSLTLAAQQEKWREKYDRIYPVSKKNQTWMYVKKGALYGAVNPQGEEIVRLLYDDIVENEFGDILIFKKDNQWGTYNPKGEIVSSFIYQKIIFDTDRYGIFKRNNKWGYMDATGEEIIPPQYDGVNNIKNERGAVGKDGKWALIDRDGQFKTTFMYDGIDNFSQNRAKVIYKGRFGVIDTAGNWVITPKYEDMYENVSLYTAQFNGKWGFIDARENEIIPFEYENGSLCNLWVKNGLICAQKGGKWGYFNQSGTVVVPFQYTAVLNFYDKLGPVYKDNKWGFVDNTGSLVIPFTYDSLHTECWGEKWMGAKRGDKWTFINSEGKELVVPIFDQVECIIDADPVRVRQNNKWGYINENGNIIVPCIYDQAEMYPNYKGLFEVKKDGVTLFFDKSGKPAKN